MNTDAQVVVEYLKLGQLEQAEQAIGQTLDMIKQTDDEEGAYELVANVQQLGYLEYAIMICQQCLANWQTDEWTITLAELYLDNSQLDEALEYLLTITEHSEIYPEALLMLAELYQLEELYEVSEMKLNQAKALLPNEPIIDLALAELYMLMGEYQHALVLYQEVEHAHIISPVDLYQKMARALVAMGLFEEAILYLEKLTKEEHHSDSLFELALAYYQISEYERAITVFEELLVKDPDYLSAYYYLAMALIETQQTAKARTILEQGIKENPYQATLYIALLSLYKQAKLEQERSELFQQAQMYLPDDTSLNVAYAYYLKEKEWYEDLVEFVNEQLTEDEDSEYYWLLAYAYGKLEQDEQAKEYYDLAYRLFQDDPQFLKDYALYLREIGQIELLATITTQLKKLNSN